MAFTVRVPSHFDEARRKFPQYPTLEEVARRAVEEYVSNLSQQYEQFTRRRAAEQQARRETQ